MKKQFISADWEILCKAQEDAHSHLIQTLKARNAQVGKRAMSW